MRPSSAFLAFGAALILGACSDGAEPAANANPPPTPIAGQPREDVRQGKGFDFYVLALSWSPTYCELEGDRANRQQCGASRSYGFVVHGLWPQYERGYPSKCASTEQDVSNDLARSMYDLMPSTGLIRHEWREHGSCSGLSPADYFDVVRAARTRVSVPRDLDNQAERISIDPNQIERDFVGANPGMPEDGIAVACRSNLVEEVRICMTKSLQFRPCPEVDRRECRASKLTMPAKKTR